MATNPDNNHKQTNTQKPAPRPRKRGFRTDFSLNGGKKGSRGQRPPRKGGNKGSASGK